MAIMSEVNEIRGVYIGNTQEYRAERQGMKDKLLSFCMLLAKSSQSHFIKLPYVIWFISTYSFHKAPPFSNILQPWPGEKNTWKRILKMNGTFRSFTTNRKHIKRINSVEIQILYDLSYMQILKQVSS